MKIWLDDVRTPPDGWVWMKTAVELVGVLADYDKWDTITDISLDHDLGAVENGDGYDVVLEIEKWVLGYGRKMHFNVSIHSANPVGRQNMQAGLDHIIQWQEEMRIV